MSDNPTKETIDYTKTTIKPLLDYENGEGTVLGILLLFAEDIEGWAIDEEYRRPTPKVMLAWADTMREAATYMSRQGVVNYLDVLRDKHNYKPQSNHTPEIKGEE